jgi:phenylacetate-CoA ligase
MLPGHEVIRRSLRDLDRTQWLSLLELEALQLVKIRDLVSYAYEHVPFYRKRYQQEGIHPRDIKSLKDFQSLPVLTREDVKDHGEELLSPGFQGKVIEGITSGSTGHPLRFLMEKTVGYWSYAAETRSRAWHGVHPGDKMARFLSTSGHDSSGHGKVSLADRLKRYRWLDSRNLSEPAMKAFADLLIAWQPAIFRVYPSALTIFAKYLKDRGVSGIRPRIIESTGEKVTPSQKRLFADVFGAPTVDHYSSLEIYSIAYQCPEGSLHVFEDRYLELLEKGKAIAPGKTGEITVTSLNQYAMPFIRYQNGDLGIHATRACSCGRGMPVLQEIGGRQRDTLAGPDGRLVHWSSIVPIMKIKPEIYQYQMHQPDERHLEVSLVCKQDVDASYLDSIRKELQPLFGESMQISVSLVNDLVPSKSGKRLFVVSDVKSDS